jgi:hypothetical protein
VCGVADAKVGKLQLSFNKIFLATLLHPLLFQMLMKAIVSGWKERKDWSTSTDVAHTVIANADADKLHLVKVLTQNVKRPRRRDLCQEEV